MTQIKNNINTYADLTAYNADTNKDYPNISYIEGTDEVKWVREDPTLITLTTTTMNPNMNIRVAYSTTNFSKMWVDGVEQENVSDVASLVVAGTHIIKYKLIDPSTIINNNFQQCSSLRTVTIQNSVTTIGDYSFSGCYNINSITIYATTPPTLTKKPEDMLGGAFYNTNNCPIYVPADSVDTYKAASLWSNVASRIQAIPA